MNDLLRQLSVFSFHFMTNSSPLLYCSWSWPVPEWVTRIHQSSLHWCRDEGGRTHIPSYDSSFPQTVYVNDRSVTWLLASCRRHRFRTGCFAVCLGIEIVEMEIWHSVRMLGHWGGHIITLRVLYFQGKSPTPNQPCQYFKAHGSNGRLSSGVPTTSI